MDLAYSIYIGVLISSSFYLKPSSTYRKQAAIIVAAAFIPMLSNLAFNFEVWPLDYIDITPFSFLLTGIMFYYALFRYKLLDVVPIAIDRLIEEMDDIVIVLDRDKRILDMNKKAIRTILTGDSVHANYIGMPITKYLNNWQELRDFILSKNINEKVKLIGVYETEFYDVTRTTIFDRRGIRFGELISLRNITELEAALQESKNAKEAAELANKARGYFLANMSHEIRTPMNAVIGIADMLKTSDLSADERKKYIRMIISSAESLLAVINDILDFSKIDAGKMDIEKNSFNLKRLTEEIINTFNYSGYSKSVKLNCKVDEALDINILGDSIRIRQILTNLTGNALKFTKEGSVDIIVTAINTDADSVKVSI
ncbi:MAG: histidine kinase dimerization/phospho-acceptor domain-containing protein [Bacillota bacterium]